ncbi:hypothetical protein JCM8547_008834 [Rhodosporidiobolus lusitaniae]
MAVVAAPPLSLPPINPPTFSPPQPPSPPLASISPLALFAAEMFCWLWFAPSPPEGAGEAGEGGVRGGVVKHQVKPTDKFVRFCHEVLTTTQVSHSVVLLALRFISRLKQLNSINGAPGSEYRLAVTGLMLANKVLDDNTYTAQTWSQVSSLELQPLVAGEAEFLKGLDWSLHVTERDFNAWLRLLEGHVAARNMRLGKVSSASSSLIPTSRKIASSRRVQTAQAEAAVRGLGIYESAYLRVPPTAEDETDETDRRVKRRVEGSVSTNTTPRTSFTLPAPASAPRPHPHTAIPAYDLGSQQPPLSATTAYVPPAHVSPTSLAYTARRNAAARAVSASSGSGKRRADEAFSSSGDSIAMYAASAVPPFFGASQAQNQMSRSFSAGPTAAPAPQSMRHPPATAPTPTTYLHPSHYVPTFPLSTPSLPMSASSPLHSRPSSSSSTASTHYPPYFGSAIVGGPSPPHYPTPPATQLPHYAPPPPSSGLHPLHPAPAPYPLPPSFQTLSHAFSPRYDPEHYRRLQQGTVSLGYYSLAAGHGLGHLRETHPPPVPASQLLPPTVPGGGAFSYAPLHPSGLSTVSTPATPGPSRDGLGEGGGGATAYPYPSSLVGQYANAGAPGVYYRAGGGGGGGGPVGAGTMLLPVPVGGGVGAGGSAWPRYG